jgi:hypothetical protein
MLLKDKQNGTLIEVLDITTLINPMAEEIRGSIQNGEEEQPPEDITKAKLIFPSGENLPRCWLDVNYQGNL